MIEVNSRIRIPASEVTFTYIRSPGPGGQNVNKVASGVLLRFSVIDSPSLPDEYKARICKALAAKLTVNGDLVIKATRYRTQERNRADAVERLAELLRKAVHVPKKRKKTKVSAGVKAKRRVAKKHHAHKKAQRGKPGVSD